MNEEYYPVVVQAVSADDFMVYAYFTDGSIHLFDAKPLIQTGGVFADIGNKDFFREKLTVLNDTVAWDLSGHFDPRNCIDIDPFTVYEAPIVQDPLAERN